MKHNLWTSVLTGAVAASALLSIILCLLYISDSRQLRAFQGRLQAELPGINNNRAAANALVNDTLEYSKKNPAIIPVLQSVGITPTSVAPAPAKPATK
jgi:hypothetical protein